MLFHVDEDVMWKLALSNVKNLMDDSNEEISVEVVANGDAVIGYVDEMPHMEKLSERGVKFVACANSLMVQGISTEELPKFVKIVDSGIVEIALKQMEGYVYVKP